MWNTGETGDVYSQKIDKKICLPMLVFLFDFVLGTHNGQHKAFSASELWAEALQIDIKTEFNQCIIHN